MISANCWRALAACGVALFLAPSCGQTSGTATVADGLEATCGSVRFDTIPADWSEFQPLDEFDGEIDLSDWEAEREFFDTHDWYVVDESRRSLRLFGVADEARASRNPTGLVYADAEFERRDGAWAPRGWGQCRIEVGTEGWGNANFVLDPDIEPDPASTTLSVLAWERECASGEVPEGRAVEAVVPWLDRDSVSVLILVEPVRGGADCQGNPSFPFEVDLGEPLGDRVVLDASFDPPVERPWPPTQTSLDSTGYDE